MCAKALGRGLESLMNKDTFGASSSKSNTIVPINSLVSRADQPRKYFDENALSELAESIKAQGVLQPIIVRVVENSYPEQYEIIAGERRFLAAKQAGLVEVPVLVRDVRREDILLIALIENMQRENLNAVEEARGIEEIRKELGLSQEEIASKIGKNRSTVANLLRLLQLSDTILESIINKEISAGHARALLSITDEDIRNSLYKAILDKDLSVRDAESAALYYKKNNSLPEHLSAIKEKKEVKNSRKKSELMVNLQKHLRSNFSSKALLSGTEESGRIVLPYESPEQLNKMLDLLGLSEINIESPETAVETNE